MAPLLVVLNPRNIPQCMDAFEHLPVQKCYIRSHTEAEIENEAFSGVLTGDPVVVVSDDALVSRGALETVLRLLEDHPVVTGWCPLSEGSELCNLSTGVLPEGPPSVQSYDFMRCDDVKGLVSTSFAGMCLTGMSRELWQRFPFMAYGTPGFASDYHLSYRLQEAGVPVVSHEDARCGHVKAVWNKRDRRWPLMVWPKGIVLSPT